MKLFYLTASIIFLSLIGCSSTYQVTDYPSKEKYHDYLNSSIRNRKIFAATTDSLFTISEGSEIKNDSLLAIVKIQEVKMSLKDIKETKYFGKDFQKPSAYILLRDGVKLLTEDVNILSDSSIQFTKVSNIPISLKQINQISYSNHFKGILPGLASGFLLGYFAGVTGLVFHITEGQMQPRRDYAMGGFIGGLSGMIIGAVVGYIIGWDNIYLISP